ncbi:hypothetical protein KIN20_027942 [Parelaphostrongylus tenuis]|uniref:Uncharacterized protein n=1 Tax=Parelaphostrongylus tenuis TaxID=148309 RepID=A0AAD5R0B8_PARTN|nr:hypothetical protein KIN20_027942 [Parelaphostrongylus tenuis]
MFLIAASKDGAALSEPATKMLTTDSSEDPLLEMKSSMNIVRRPTFLVSLLTTMSTLLGCGVLPQGQARSWRFTVSGFSFPVNVAYSDSPAVRAQFPGLAATREAASSFVSRLVMQTVTDALEQQGSSVGLPDFIISNILSQLMIQTTMILWSAKMTIMITMPPQCVIVGSTVTSLCTFENDMRCDITIGDVMPIAVQDRHRTIGGTLTTTNIVMANWSGDMWQRVVNKAAGMLEFGLFSSHFFSAVATVN